MDFSKDEYTTKEAAGILGISEFTLRRKIRNKEINVIGKKGKSYIISKEELERYTKKKEIPNISEKQAYTMGKMMVANRSISDTILDAFFDGMRVATQEASWVNALPIEKYMDIFRNKDVEFYKEYYKSKQKDLNIAKLELEKLMLDKDDTIEYKKNELDLRIQIMSIKRDLQIIKMKIDSMSK